MEQAGQNGNKKIQTKSPNWKEMNDTDEHKNQKYKEAEKRRKTRIDKILMEHRLSHSQPNQAIITKKVDHEEAMDIIKEKNPDVQNLEEIVPKTYTRVD